MNHNINFENMSKEQLINYIKNITEDRNLKFGLAWDKAKEPEQIVVDCDKYVPVLNRCKDKEINYGGENNLIIEGDNFHSLTILNYTHKEAIDVIYIDPPYNTGHKDFKYNDSFVDLEDGYRHSKWLNFMEKRLKLAKNLLKEDGVMFISIDDNEYAELKLLCTHLFGENNIETMIWHKVDNDSGKLKITHRFRNEHEYILVVYPNKAKCRHFNKFMQKRTYKHKYSNPDNDPRGPYKQGIISDTEEKSSKNSPNYYSITTPSGRIITRRFRVSKEEFNKLVADNRIYFGKDGNSIPSLKIFINEEGEATPVSILENLGTAKTAGLSLNTLFDGQKVFNYPKPVELIKHLIQISSKSNDTILDFFAGSGTTAQAILELNQQDGGNRKFILCTNNENNICSEVTHPRITKVIKGYNNIPPISASLKYFTTDFVENSDNHDQLYFDLTEKCIPMLCIKENCFDLYDATNEYKIYTNHEKNKFICVYHDFFDDRYIEFIDKLTKIKEQKTIYIFSLSEYIDEQKLENVKNYKIEPIPYKIVELYRQLVKISKGD